MQAMPWRRDALVAYPKKRDDGVASPGLHLFVSLRLAMQVGLHPIPIRREIESDHRQMINPSQ